MLVFVNSCRHTTKCFTVLRVHKYKETHSAVYVIFFIKYWHFVQTDPMFWELETSIFLKPGPRLDKYDNKTPAFPCAQLIRTVYS